MVDGRDGGPVDGGVGEADGVGVGGDGDGDGDGDGETRLGVADGFPVGVGRGDCVRLGDGEGGVGDGRRGRGARPMEVIVVVPRVRCPPISDDSGCPASSSMPVTTASASPKTSISAIAPSRR
jgi:hypothetical protein